jgi:xylan 1,4-beta-xylosidase
VLDAGGAQQPEPVTIRVDTAVRKGPMYPFWAWYGHDEPNYTYTANGQKLLSALQDLSPVPVFVRVHNLLTSGDGTYALKWGSTNVYSEDASGRPVYDWMILDRIVDTYVARKMKPFVQLGFMPEALSSAPSGTPYRHFWKPGDRYDDIYTGWTYAPKDYRKWEELCYQVTKHLVEKYGRQQVESWWFELWNEPDIGYWSGSVGPSAGRSDPLSGEKAQTRRDEFNKLYDFTVAGVRRALPAAADRWSRSDGRRAGDVAHVPAAHVSGHQLRDRNDRHAARPHHVPRQREPDVHREPRAHGRGESASQHQRSLRRHQGVPDLREDADRDR